MRYQEHDRGFLRVSVRAFVVAAVGLMLILAAQTSTSTRPALARPTDVLSFSPNVCISLMRVIEGDCNGSGTYTAGECDAACAATLGTADGLNDLARGLDADVSDTVGAAPESDIGACGDGIDDEPDTVVDDGCATGYNDPALFQDLNDLSGAQLGDYSADDALTQGKLWVLTFVSNDGALTLEADEGIWHSNGASNTNCGAIADEDCNNDGIKGDGIVVDLLLGNGVADLGNAELVTTQSGVDVISDYWVVGEPYGISLWASKSTLQQHAAATCDVAEFDTQIALADVAGLVATVEDDGGTPLTGVTIGWQSSNSAAADLGVSSSVSMQTTITAALNLACGDLPGTATITASVTGVGQDQVELRVESAPVGGIAEYPEVAPDTVARTHDLPGTSSLAVAGLAAGGTLLLAAGAWYARRRWLR